MRSTLLNLIIWLLIAPRTVPYKDDCAGYLVKKEANNT